MENPQPSRNIFGLTSRALGLVLIFLTAIIWVAASFISQLLVNTEEGKPSFNVSPFLLTYLSTSVFTIFLPLVQLKSLLQETWLLRRSFKYKALTEADNDADAWASTTGSASHDSQQVNGHHQHQQQHHQPQQQPQQGADDAAVGSGGLAADLDLAEAAAAAQQASAAARASALAHKESMLAAAQCFALWFTAQYLFNKSLSLTSVTSNTILSSTSSLFTFALSMLVLKEPYSMAKLLSIAACIAGTLLVTLSDKDSSQGISSRAAMGGASIHNAPSATNTTLGGPTSLGSTATAGPSHSVIGDMLCLISAMFYASYTIVLRRSLPDDDEANVALFFGYVGLLCSVVFAPVVVIMAGVGSMHLKTIPPKAYLLILIEGVLNYCLSDYLWAHAVLLLGPTIATLGLSVQIPVAAVVEVLIGVPRWLSNGRSMAMMLGGTALIMLGFFAGNLAGGGRVYGSHHRGGDAAEQRQRTSTNTAMDASNFNDDDDDNEVLQDLLNTHSSIVIPVSTHASSGPRVTSPTSEVTSPTPNDGNYSITQGSSFGRSLHQSGLQQQQQQQRAISPVRSPAVSPARKGAYTAVGLEADDEVLQQRLSVEMSELGSSGSARSTPMSLQDGTTHGPTTVGLRPRSPRPASLVVDVAAGAVEASAGDAWNSSSSSPQHQSGTGMSGSSPPSEGGKQLSQQQTQQVERLSPTAAAAMARSGSNSPRWRAAVPVARLGQQEKAGHHADGQSVIGKG